MTVGAETRRLPLDEAGLGTAADLLKDGALVAFPTETVYGLGGDATNDLAVAKIFETKGRPEFNPLIVHVSSIEEAKELTRWSDTAEKLAGAFWPGALTFVVPRSDNCPVSKLASAGLETLAIRLPGHDLARELIQWACCPVAAPSANLFGRLSPTTADHVLEQLGGLVAGVIDGGPCAVGVESTVIDLTTDQPVLLRPGGIEIEALSEVIGDIGRPGDNDEIKSPGMLTRHYAPSTPIRLNATHVNEGEALLGFGKTELDCTANLSATGNLTEAAANLFAMLHDLDRAGHQGIAVAPIPETGLGQAINDRLRRAASSD